MSLASAASRSLPSAGSKVRVHASPWASDHWSGRSQVQPIRRRLQIVVASGPLTLAQLLAPSPRTSRGLSPAWTDPPAGCLTMTLAAAQAFLRSPCIDCDVSQVCIHHSTERVVATKSGSLSGPNSRIMVMMGQLCRPGLPVASAVVCLICAKVLSVAPYASMPYCQAGLAPVFISALAFLQTLASCLILLSRLATFRNLPFWILVTLLLPPPSI